MAVTVAVQRTRTVDASPTWERYSLDLGERATVLDALLVIAERQDGTLAFRAECRSGICGACAGLVNGAPRLFCQTLIFDAIRVPRPQLVDAEIAIAPLPSFPVLKDLVVDVDDFFDAMRTQHAWVEPAATYDGVVPPEIAERLWDVAGCILCALCVQDAPPAVPNPAVAARLLRIASDPRDARGAEPLTRLGPADPRRHVAALSAHLAECCPAGVDIRRLAAGQEPLPAATVPSGSGDWSDGRSRSGGSGEP